MNNEIDNITLQIKEEQLHISKSWVQTGEVNVYKETFLEEKIFKVPVTREELVIEKKVPNSGECTVSEQVLRIPLSEEKVEFTKHKVNLEDVSIYREQIQDIKHIEETLKKEQIKINTYGSANVIENSSIKST